MRYFHIRPSCGTTIDNCIAVEDSNTSFITFLLSAIGKYVYGTFTTDTGSGEITSTGCWLIVGENDGFCNAGYATPVVNTSAGSTATITQGCEECCSSAPCFALGWCELSAGDTFIYTDDPEVAEFFHNNIGKTVRADMPTFGGQIRYDSCTFIKIQDCGICNFVDRVYIPNLASLNIQYVVDLPDRYNCDNCRDFGPKYYNFYVCGLTGKEFAFKFKSVLCTGELVDINPQHLNRVIHTIDNNYILGVYNYCLLGLPNCCVPSLSNSLFKPIGCFFIEETQDPQGAAILESYNYDVIFEPGRCCEECGDSPTPGYTLQGCADFFDPPTQTYINTLYLKNPLIIHGGPSIEDLAEGLADEHWFFGSISIVGPAGAFTYTGCFLLRWSQAECSWTGNAEITFDSFKLLPPTTGIPTTVGIPCDCTEPPCWLLTECGDLSPEVTYTVSTDLSTLEGKILNGVILTGGSPDPDIDPESCWIVSKTDPCLSDLELDSYLTSYNDCCDCIPIPDPSPEIPIERVYPKPVKRFYQITEAQCDIDNTINFGNMFYNISRQLKQGISSYYTPIQVMKMWVKKRLTDLNALNDPEIVCITRQVTTPRCFPTIPRECRVQADVFGRTLITVITGESIQAYKVVYIKSDGKAYLNNPLDTSTYQRVIGLSSFSVQIGASLSVIASGSLRVPGWGLTSGGIYYAAPSGGITTTVPTSGISQVIGIASDKDTLVIDIKQPIIL